MDGRIVGRAPVTTGVKRIPLVALRLDAVYIATGLIFITSAGRASHRWPAGASRRTRRSPPSIRAQLIYQLGYCFCRQLSSLIRDSNVTVATAAAVVECICGGGGSRGFTPAGRARAALIRKSNARRTTQPPTIPYAGVRPIGRSPRSFRGAVRPAVRCTLILLLFTTYGHGAGSSSRSIINR